MFVFAKSALASVETGGEGKAHLGNNERQRCEVFKNSISLCAELKNGGPLFGFTVDVTLEQDFRQVVFIDLCICRASQSKKTSSTFF